jgi:hypothetical protein
MPRKTSRLCWCPVDELVAELGPGTQVSGFATSQDLAVRRETTLHFVRI